MAAAPAAARSAPGRPGAGLMWTMSWVGRGVSCVIAVANHYSRRRRRGAGADHQWDRRLGQRAIGLQVGVEEAEGQRGQFLDLGILGHDHLLKGLRAAEAERVGRIGVDFRRGGERLEIAPGRLLRQGERVERAATGNLDPHGDGVARRHIGRPGGHVHGEAAHGAVETGRHILCGQRQRLDRLRLRGHGHLLLLGAGPEEPELLEDIARTVARGNLEHRRGGNGTDGEGAGLDGPDGEEQTDHAIGRSADLHAPLAGLVLLDLAQGEAIGRHGGQLEAADIEHTFVQVKLEFADHGVAQVNLLAREDEFEEGVLGAGLDRLGRRRVGLEDRQLQRLGSERGAVHLDGEGGEGEVTDLARAHVIVKGNRGADATVIVCRHARGAEIADVEIRDVRQGGRRAGPAVNEAQGQGHAFAQGDGVAIQRSREGRGAGRHGDPSQDQRGQKSGAPAPSESPVGNRHRFSSHFRHSRSVSFARSSGRTQVPLGQPA